MQELSTVQQIQSTLTTLDYTDDEQVERVCKMIQNRTRIMGLIEKMSYAEKNAFTAYQSYKQEVKRSQ